MKRQGTIFIAAWILATTVHAQSSRKTCESLHCPDDAIYQVTPAQAFAQGLFEGPTPFRQLLQLGDFGLGALSPADGEVIVLDGRAYHARLDGKLRTIAGDEATAFAFVKKFRDDRRVSLPQTASFDELTRALDGQLSSVNRFYAIRVDAEFPYLKLRSVPRQKPPYPPLDEVIRTQNTFEASNVRGTLVGFRLPAYIGVNASGYHMHFVDADRTLGGHVLDVRTPATSVQVDESVGFTLILPDDPAFDRAQFQSATPSSLERAVRPR